MTTPSSNKRSPFGTYFCYRMRQQSCLAMITLILNILGIGLFSATTLAQIKSQYLDRVNGTSNSVSYDFSILSDGLVVLSTIAALALALFGATRAFDYCLKKDHTDTFYGLPVTLREKFRADFLSGFISHVATLIPCSIFSIIISISSDDYYSKLFNLTGYPYESGCMIKIFSELNLTLFFAYMFAYLLSVIITVCCGRTNSSVAFTSLSAIIALFTGCVVNGFVQTCRVGVDYLENIIIDSLENIPPLGLFFIKLWNITQLSFDPEGMSYEISPVLYVILVLTAAAITAAAYFIFKHRRPENTGRPIAVRGFYYVFSGIIAFTLICMICLIMYQLHMWWVSALISVIAAGITLLIFTVASRQERSDFKKNMIRSGIVIAGCLALLFITDKTGVFGTRYYNISPARTQSIKVSLNDYTKIGTYGETIIIDDKADIEQFIKSTNRTLKKRSDELDCGGGFHVLYNLANGKTVERSYSTSYYSDGSETSVLTELCDNVYALSGYPQYSSISAAESIGGYDISKDISVTLHDQFGEITIPKERFEELKAVITSEILEKYDSSAKTAGVISVSGYDKNNWINFSHYIPIRECYTDTISFAESLRTYDGEAEAFIISKYDYNNNNSLNVTIKIKNVNDEAEKELFSLLEPVTRSGQHSSNGFNVSVSNRVNYYVPEENKERIIDLMLTVIDKNFSQKSE